MTSPPSLSVVTFTNDPPHRVAAALGLLRDVADEIVVAVDASVDPDTLGPLVDVADRLLRAEFVHPLEANLAWLHEQASCDWVLRVDGDDVVSDALVERLRTPGWDTGVTHAYVSYRWLWGAPDRMLAQPPWWPDPALRLIRNVDGIARFPHGAHRPPVVAGDARFLDEALYHLDLLLADEQAREQKADRYERAATGLRIDQGWSVNSTYYLPERLDPPPRTVALPAADVAAVARVLSATADPATAAPVTGIPLVTAAEREPSPPGPGDAALRVVADPPLAAVSGRTYTVTIGVTNRSTRTWRPGDASPVALGATLRTADSGAAIGGEMRAPLPGALPPGEEALVRLAVPNLPAGPAILDVGLVEEGRGWHDARIEVPVDVQRGRRLLVVPSISPYRHLGDDLITVAALRAVTRHLPDVVPVLLVHPPGDVGHRFGVLTAASPAAARPATEAPRSTASTLEPWAADLVRDARRVAGGEPPLDPAHGPFIEPFLDAGALLVTSGGALTGAYGDEGVAPMALAVRMAEAVGLPVLVEGAYVGPVERRRDRLNILRITRAARRLTVRDAGSAAALRELGHDGVEPVVVPDLATATVDLARRTAATDARAWLRAHGIDDDRPYAVFSLRAGVDDHDQVVSLRAATERLPDGAAAVYLPHVTGEVADDRAVLGQDPWAASHLAVVGPEVDDLTAAAVVAGAAVTVGSRFHLSVLARAAGVPAVAMVGSRYDATRLVALGDDPGLFAVASGDPAETADATARALARGRDAGTEVWDGAAFAAALSEVLPPAPRLA